MKGKHALALFGALLLVFTNVTGAAELTVEPMATTLIGSNYEHRIWTTTTNELLASFTQTDNSWQTVKSGVRGGVAATTLQLAGSLHERVFVPTRDGIADLTLQAGSMVADRLLTTATADPFFGSDVGIIRRSGRIMIAAVSTSGKFCIWVGPETAALSPIYCSSEHLADPQTTIAAQSHNQYVFYFRAQDATLHAMHVVPHSLFGSTIYFATDHEIGVPPLTSGIGPALAHFSHPASNDEHLAVNADNAVWIARYHSENMSVSWTSLGAPASPPKLHRSAIHMDGTWFSSFTSDRTHCNTLVSVIGQDGQLYQTWGHSSVAPTSACSDSSYRGNTWERVPRTGFGRFGSTITTTTHQSSAFRFIKHYAMDQFILLWPSPRVYGSLLEYVAPDWLSRGKP